MDGFIISWTVVLGSMVDTRLEQYQGKNWLSFNGDKKEISVEEINDKLLQFLTEETVIGKWCMVLKLGRRIY
jgi:hypothetical protein